MAHRKHHYRPRHHNPFTTGGIAPLATKVAGGLAGGIGAAVIPNMLGSMGSGWAGVIAALAVAFGGSWLTRGMSANLSEGILIGGTLQAAGRVAQLTIGKNIVSFSLSGYDRLNFPIPTPSYIPGGGVAQLPAARIPGGTAGVTSVPKPAGMSGVRTRGMRAVA